MRLAWLTDLHLEFAEPAAARAFLKSVREADAALVITGDISHAARVESDLRALKEAASGKPIYFVLGNHDYYNGSIEGVRERISRRCAADSGYVWLSESEPIELSPTTALIGHDGWGDGIVGDWEHAVMLNDEFLIQELTGADRHMLLVKLRALGEQAAAHLRQSLGAALRQYPQILLATHVSPFRESCWYEGRTSGEEWLPRFTCDAVGKVLRELMTGHPRSQLTVLCGHSHGEGYAEILPNLRVWTGGAEYGRPRVQKILEY